MNERLRQAITILHGAGLKRGDAMSMVQELGAMCVVAAKDQQAPAFVRGILPLEAVEEAMSNGMAATAIYVSEETHRAMAERAGAPTLVTADRKPIGHAPHLTLGRAAVRPMRGLMPGAALVIEAVLSIVPQPTP